MKFKRTSEGYSSGYYRIIRHESFEVLYECFPVSDSNFFDDLAEAKEACRIHKKEVEEKVEKFLAFRADRVKISEGRLDKLVKLPKTSKRQWLMEWLERRIFNNA